MALANTVRLTLVKRGGAGAGDPNHPSLQIDPNATYNPFPPKSTYLADLDKSIGSQESSSSKRSITIGIIITILGLTLILIGVWFLHRRCSNIVNRRKRTRDFSRKKRLSSSTSSSFMNGGSRRFMRFPFGSSSSSSSTINHDGIQDHHTLDLDPFNGTYHQGLDKNSIYAHEVFEMSREFNQSSFSLPYETPLKNRLNNFQDEEDEEEDYQDGQHQPQKEDGEGADQEEEEEGGDRYDTFNPYSPPRN